MSCEDLILAEDVNTLCSPVTMRYRDAGYVYDYNDIDKGGTTIVDGKVVLSLTNGAEGVKVYDRSFDPFSGVTRTSEANDRYVVFHDQAILPLFVNNQINAKLVNVFGRKKIIIVLESVAPFTDKTGRWPIFGLIGGLVEQSSVHEPYGIVANEVTMVDMNTGYPALFLDPLTDAFMAQKLKASIGDGYAYINGLTIETGDTIAFTVAPVGSQFYLRKPDNTVQLVTTSISSVWAGADGTIEIIVPSPTVTYAETASIAAKGVFSTNITTEVKASDLTEITGVYAPLAGVVRAIGCTSMVKIYCPNATEIYVQNCNLSALAMAKLFIDLDAAGNSDGLIIASGGTNPTLAQIQAASAEGYAAHSSLLSKSWDITLN